MSSELDIVRSLTSAMLASIRGKISKNKQEIADIQQGDGGDTKDNKEEIRQLSKVVFTLSEQLLKLELLEHKLTPPVNTDPTTFDELVLLLTTDEYRRKEGRRNCLMQLCVESEKERLTQPHTFSERIIDLAFLTPEIVLKKKAEQEKEHNERENEIE